MGIESTITVKRSDAKAMLEEKGCKIYDNECTERLQDMLYEYRESIFENYHVVENDYVGNKWELWKTHW